jgi:hypothetical protein
MIGALRAQPVGEREGPVEVLRVDPAGQRRHLVHYGIGLGRRDRLAHGAAVESVDHDRPRTEAPE